MSQFTSSQSVERYADTGPLLVGRLIEEVVWYTHYEGGPVLIFPRGIEGDYSDPWWTRWARRLSGLTDEQLILLGIMHDELLRRGARPVDASATMFSMARALRGDLLYCLGMFLGTWVKTRKGKS